MTVHFPSVTDRWMLTLFVCKIAGFIIHQSSTSQASNTIVHRLAHHGKPVSDHYGNAIGLYGNPSACARSVYQALSPPLEGPGYEATIR
jgi:hypothetical protein